MATIKQTLALAGRLDGLSDTARLDVAVLLAHALERDKTYLYTWPDREYGKATVRRLSVPLAPWNGAESATGGG